MLVFDDAELFSLGAARASPVEEAIASSTNSTTMLDIFCRIWREAAEIRPLVDGKFVFTDDILDGDAADPHMSEEEFREDARKCIQVYILVRHARLRKQCRCEEALQIADSSPRITVIHRLGVCRISEISSVGTEEAEIFSVEKVRGLMEAAFAEFDASTAVI